ncbi:hypothetical protein NC651_028093 [Populus alba x Populus x berolinensis]|nr:hypothetical protein NC651_028093 [Populus alba x Populus x berolinensis]
MIHKVRNLSWSSSIKEAKMRKDAMQVLGMDRHDIIAQIYYVRRLAKKLQPVARLVDLHGGHLVSHERTEEGNTCIYEH